ncbi:MAG: arginine--tRNA ligase [Candidatus Jacksonbacteria bacterium]|nr:arginine--tRNA ligase [Candidatus Jacksonbacteria bacterium]MBT7338516.1 arginine--tRNA ligase [Candidatus Jacksonbacteria bacterium]
MTQWSTIEKSIIEEIEELVQSKADCLSGEMVVCPNPLWGDVSLPCFALAKILKKSPDEIAKTLAEKISDHVAVVLSARADGGFLNITLTNKALFADVLTEVFEKKEEYGKPQHPLGTYIVEYASPNTNKPLHLGHLRNIVIGQAGIQFLKFIGHTVVPAEIINDRGIHIMKSLLAYQKWGEGDTPEKSKMKGDHFVGKYYVLFSSKVKEQPELDEEAQGLLKKLESGDKEITKQWKQLNDWVIAGIKETYNRLGVEFEEEDFESDIYKQGKEVVDLGKETKIFSEREDGAVIANLEDVGLDEKVVLRSDGTAIYITQDLALAQLRNERHPELNGILHVVAREQEYHFRVLFEILKRLEYSWASKSSHVSYGLVNLPSGRMKSREGTVVDADALLDELHAIAEKEITDRWEDLPAAAVTERAEMIAQAALRFYLLRVTLHQDMIYDPEESISLDGATGPYLQYTVTRIKSILEKKSLEQPDSYDILKEIEERKLALHLLRFPHVVEMISEQLQESKQFNISVLAQFSLELAQDANSFYQKHRVLDVKDKELVSARHALLTAVASVLSGSLSLCSIEVPEKM